ncbi:MAG: GHKL domain-containing protein [Candidatus Nitronauta litoralis]|uniref:histidine kinase n=1 Tax=Candidatus Nitronauta litoralis TaxID=2705533 RepID=A0A7T0BXA3_9BACT|nr:MAG: GHKL domain-containing protein [Candidatus Nitronauta litoralis]
MDKQEQLQQETPQSLKSRLDHLERKNQWYYSALELVASLGEIHRSFNHLEDPVEIFRDASPLIQRVVPFDTMALYLVESEPPRFESQTCEPKENQNEVQDAVHNWIENGTFAWALQQTKPMWLEEKKGNSTWLLQALATRSTVLGMIVARIPEDQHRPHQDTSKVLSIIAQHIAQAIENALLFRKTSKQNQELEKLVKKRTLALETKTVELEAQVREVNDFSHLASHDLREPLRKLTLFSDRLKLHLQANLDEKTSDYLGIMNRAVNRLETQIEGLLNLSRVTTQGRPIQKIQLDRSLQFVINELAMEIEESGALIEVDSLPSLHADPIQMQQMFSNLLHNAIKYRSPGKTPEIRVTAVKNENGFWLIGIHDNGIGIEPEQQDKIFKPFERLHGQKQYEGVGMGLSICRKIVERHGGSLYVESDIGKGASFFINLPESG